jgi:hypothetical protein
LYGLKQDNEQWYSKFSGSLKTIDYTQSSADYSLFIKINSTTFNAILIYVDDIVTAENNSVEIQYVKPYIDNCIKIKDLGNLRYFLGLKISRPLNGILINQRKYSLDLLDDIDTLASKPTSTPCEPS